MGFLFKPQKKDRLVAIFDIGSGSVGGAIVSMPSDKDGSPTILKSHRTEISFRHNLDFNIFLQDMLSALKHTANFLYKQGVGAPDEIVCVLASPWFISETRVIKMSRESTFIFTKKIADELLNKEIAALNDLYEGKYKSANSTPEVIEHQIMNVALNGYNVSDPIGKKSKSVEMNMVISLSPKICLNDIRVTIEETFHATPISFATFPLASYMAVREKYVNTDSYLLLDISGEVTDVSIVSKGVLKASFSFPFGKKAFYKYICTKFEVELRDAKEMTSLYLSNNLTEERRQKLLPLFKSIENSWSESFRGCIARLPHAIALPGTIFLTADADIRKWFVDVIHDEEYIKSMVVERECTVITLEGPEFLNMCSVKAGTCDPFLMIEAISVMRRKVK